jgi:Niemann-Pick C1 protein
MLLLLYSVAEKLYGLSPHATIRNTQAPDDMPICGDMFKGKDVCCTIEQLNSLQISTGEQASVVLSRCPSCFENFVTFWCQFTCSPDQSTFSTIKSVNNQTGLVTDVLMEVDEVFAEKVFDNCAGVSLVAGGSVMNAFGGAKNYNEFFKFLGKSSFDLKSLMLEFEFTFVFAPAFVHPAPYN